VRKLIAIAVLTIPLSSLLSGCSGPDDVSLSGGTTIHPAQPVLDTVNVGVTITWKRHAKSDVQSRLSSYMSLVDMPSQQVTVASTGDQSATVTITTDTGATFTRTFSLAQANAAGIAPVDGSSETFAFVAADSTALTDFVNSALSQSASTADVQINSSNTFSPQNGNFTGTSYSRAQTAVDGVSSVGQISVSYYNPSLDNNGCTPQICPIQN
jgi:hypothetical protein